MTIVAGVATALVLRQPPAAPVPSLRLSLSQPDELLVGGGPDYPFGLALAPDGRRLVFPASNGESRQLWLRDLTNDDRQPLPGTADGVLPFWSPDGRSLGFFAAGRLRVFVFEDGRVHDLADAPRPRGAAWHSNGDILFAPDDEGPLLRRSADGRVEPFTPLDGAAERSHRLPQFANGGTHVTFFVRSPEPTREGIWLAPYDQPQNRKRLVKSEAHGVPVDRVLVYSSGGALVAQAIDIEARTLTGRPLLLGNAVGQGPQNQIFATAAGDVIVFGGAASGLRELRWVDRQGRTSAVLGEPMDANEVRISPAGESVAVARVDLQLSTRDIWNYEAARPLPRRMSSAIDGDETPAWSADGRRLAWVTARRAITLRDAAPTGTETTLRKLANPAAITDWRDRWLVVSETSTESRSDILLLPDDSSGEPRPYAQSPFNEIQGAVSPDGRWLAYASDESGRFEIYVDAFPAPGRRGRLSVGGGLEPRWSRDGRELFFRRGAEVHAVRLALTAGAPEALSSDRLFDAGADIRSFDVAPDGQRFLLNLPAADGLPKPLTVLVHVASLLPSAR